MKFPVGYGGITKLKGKRSKPYMAYVSEMVTQGVVIPPDTQKSLEMKMRALQEASTVEEVNSLYCDLLTELFFTSGMSVEEYRNKIAKAADREIKGQTFKAKQRKKPIGYYKTAPEANIALAEYNKSPYDLDKRKVTFKEIYELAYKDARIDKKSSSTQKGYNAAYGKCVDLYDMPLSEIKHSHLQDIVNKNSGMSRSSLSNILAVYNMVFAYAMKNELADKNAAEFVKIEEHREEEEREPFTREEVQYLWKHLDWKYETNRKSNLKGETLSDILLILIYTGMRINELLGVKAEDVHIEERYIDLRGTKTKAARRLVPIHKGISPLIEKRLARGGEYLMVNLSGKRLTYDQLYSTILEAFCSQHEMDHTFHETRHTFATFTKASKLDPTLRQFIMGHANKDITDDVYTHPEVLLPELIAEIDKLEI